MHNGQVSSHARGAAGQSWVRACPFLVTFRCLALLLELLVLVLVPLCLVALLLLQLRVLSLVFGLLLVWVPMWIGSLFVIMILSIALLRLPADSWLVASLGFSSEEISFVQ